MRVYIVEDSSVMLERIMESLQTIKRVQIIGTTDIAGTALADIVKYKPDLLILDIMLKSGNGMEILKGLKQEYPGMIIIMLTNYNYTELKERCVELGADYFFDKSVDFNRVAEVVRELLSAG